MIRKTPIGCGSFHFTRKVGKDNVCFYCGEKFTSFLESGTVYNYTPGDFTIDKFNELCKITDEHIENRQYTAQMNAVILLELDDEDFIAMYLNKNIYYLAGSIVWEKIDKRAKELGILTDKSN